jgi:hypothetical protein
MTTLDLPPMPAELGITRRQPDPDFTASVDGGFTETFEAYCDRISKQEA